MTRQPFRDAGHAALARADVLEHENERLRSELVSARAALVQQQRVARLSPHRVFVRSMLLAATLVAAALLVAVKLAWP